MSILIYNMQKYWKNQEKNNKLSSKLRLKRVNNKGKLNGWVKLIRKKRTKNSGNFWMNRENA